MVRVTTSQNAELRSLHRGFRTMFYRNLKFCCQERPISLWRTRHLILENNKTDNNEIELMFRLQRSLNTARFDCQ